MTRLLLSAALLTFAITSHAQIPQPDPDTTTLHFLTVASIKNLQEASAGQQAVEKAGSSELRSFGKMMVMDHGQNEQELMRLANSKGYRIPPAASGGIQPDLLLKLQNGDKFDRLFVHAMVPGHRDAVQTFTRYATVGKDPDVREFARRTLPTLQKHLDEIGAIEKRMADEMKTKQQM